MPKTIRNKFYEKLTFESMLAAEVRSSKNKKNKYEVLLFEEDLETNIINLINRLKKGTYNIGDYREFVIYEPKKRVIKSLPYIDRIVHQWYVYEFIKTYIYPRLINDTFACLDNRGTHKAIDKVQKYMCKMKRQYGCYYVLKMDIQKFFYSIDKELLFDIMKKYINDKRLIDLTYKFIFDNDEKIGIPIGNYTSQYFANIYLNELDHFVKDELKVKYYIRYMDDFILFVPSKKEAKRKFQEINIFVKEKLNLSLNSKSCYFPNNRGIDFCGFKIYETHRLLRKRCKIKIKKKIKKWNNQYAEGVIDLHYVLLCYNSYLGHSSHGNSYNFNKKIKEEMKFTL